MLNSSFSYFLFNDICRALPPNSLGQRLWPGPSPFYSCSSFSKRAVSWAASITPPGQVISSLHQDGQGLGASHPCLQGTQPALPGQTSPSLTCSRNRIPAGPLKSRGLSRARPITLRRLRIALIVSITSSISRRAFGSQAASGSGQDGG